MPASICSRKLLLASAVWLPLLANVRQPTARGDVTLVKDGRAVATIVAAIPAEAVESAPAKGGKRRAGRGGESGEVLAVRTLVQWIQKITDAELPVAQAAEPGRPAIYVGQAAVQAGLKLDDIRSPSREGVRIVADDRRVLLAGQTEAATLKAACRFLEELGCRYFMEGPLGEVFPRSRTLTVRRCAITEQPGLMGRNPKGPSWHTTFWKAWNGAGGEMIQHQHAWGGYLPEGLFAEHPEYFAQGADGQRKSGSWLCTSNRELRKYFAERVIAAIERGTRHPSLSPPDGRGYCQCSKCRAQDDPQSVEPSSGTVSVTNRYVDFLDDVARRVAAVHPDSVLSFYCYADYTQPPTVRRKLAPNLCAVIAPIRYCRLHEIGHPGCPSREQQVAMLDGWSAVASRLGYYNYMYNLADGTLPFFKFTACQKEFPYLHARGVSFMTIEVLSNWHIYGPQIYLSLRLAYDPQADADAIMEDYWQKFYGPQAGPWMKQYWMAIDAEVGKLSSHAGGFFGLQQIYTADFLKHCESLLTRAAEAARGEAAYEQRVALHAAGFQSAVEYRRLAEAMQRGDFARAAAVHDKTLGRLRSLADQGGANPEYATAYWERFLGKTVRAGAAWTAAPNRLVQVLPDRWRFTFDEQDQGRDHGYQTADFDDSAWPSVATYSTTLDAQGFDKTTILWYRTTLRVPDKHGRLALFFGEVDGLTEVYLNGRKLEVLAEPGAEGPSAVPPLTPEGQVKPRVPFAVDLSPTVRTGDNTVALRVDHSKLTELSLGGILRPVLLVERR